MLMNKNSLFIKMMHTTVAILLISISAAGYAVEEDPWEGMNRKIFVFNEQVDKYLFKPLARSYDWLTPRPVDDHITNVFDNLRDVGVFLNDALQGKFERAISDAGRVLLNTTLGVGGIFDVATHLGLDKHEEDFGQTFAVWRIGSGPYLVLPFLGASTVRDAIGRIPDAYTRPQLYLDHVPTRNSVYGVDLVDTRADLLKVEKMIQGDRYLFIRDAYLQRRNFLIADGQIEDDFTSDDLDDE